MTGAVVGAGGVPTGFGPVGSGPLPELGGGAVGGAEEPGFVPPCVPGPFGPVVPGALGCAAPSPFPPDVGGALSSTAGRSGARARGSVTPFDAGRGAPVEGDVGGVSVLVSAGGGVTGALVRAGVGADGGLVADGRLVRGELGADEPLVVGLGSAFVVCGAKP